MSNIDEKIKDMNIIVIEDDWENVDNYLSDNSSVVKHIFRHKKYRCLTKLEYYSGAVEIQNYGSPDYGTKFDKFINNFDSWHPIGCDAILSYDELSILYHKRPYILCVTHVDNVIGILYMVSPDRHIIEFNKYYRVKDTVAEEIDKMNNSKRNYRIAVKLNEEENKQLEFISKELGISRAEAIRELITDSSYELYYGYKRGKKND